MMHMIAGVTLCCAVLQVNSNFEEQGRAEYRSGQYAAAEASFVSALSSLERGRHDGERARILAELGNVLVNEDKLLKAEQVYGQSFAIYKRLGDQRQISLLLRHLGAVYSLAGRDDDALLVLRQALKLTRANHDVGIETEVLNVIGVVYYRQNRNNKAANCFNQALAAASSAGVQTDPGELLNNLGNVYQAAHKYEEAEAFLKRALNEIESAAGLSHPDLTFTLQSLGTLYTAIGRYADAEDQYLRALTILEPNEPEFETRIARLLHALSATYAKAGRKADAEAALSRAARIARGNLAQHAEMASIVEEYAESLRKQRKSKEAAELLLEARRARAAASLVTTAR